MVNRLVIQISRLQKCVRVAVGRLMSAVDPLDQALTSKQQTLQGSCAVVTVLRRLVLGWHCEVQPVQSETPFCGSESDGVVHVVE